MKKKYELVKDDTIEVNSFGCLKVLYRIKALKDFNDVKKGDLGGYIEKEDNLSHEGNCWIYDNAKVSCGAEVYCNALVYGDAEIRECAIVFGDTEVYDNAVIRGNAMVFGNARVFGNAIVSDDAKVFGKSEVFNSSVLTVNAYITNTNDYINIGPIGSRDAYTTFYLNKDKKIIVNCGCFNDTIEEFIKAVNRTHKDNKKYRSQYIGAITYAKCVLYNESIL